MEDGNNAVLAALGLSSGWVFGSRLEGQIDGVAPDAEAASVDDEGSSSALQKQVIRWPIRSCGHVRFLFYATFVEVFIFTSNSRVASFPNGVPLLRRGECSRDGKSKESTILRFAICSDQPECTVSPTHHYEAMSTGKSLPV